MPTTVAPYSPRMRSSSLNVDPYLARISVPRREPAPTMGIIVVTLLLKWQALSS